MPDMFEKAKKIYPEIENRIEDIDYQNKFAKVLTLLPDKVKLGTKILEWDGSVIRAEGNQRRRKVCQVLFSKCIRVVGISVEWKKKVKHKKLLDEYSCVL